MSVKMLEQRSPEGGQYGAMASGSLYDRSQPLWTSKAACRGLPLQRWFPEFAGLPEADHLEAAWPAKLTCFTCPVRVECLERAWTMDDDYGVSGGLTPLERHRTRGQSPAVALLVLDIQVLGELKEAISA